MKVNELWNHFEKELERYVTIDRFTPIEKVVYGGVGIILTAVLVYLVSLAVKK